MQNESSRGSALALLPLLTFLAVFLGSGIYFNLKGTEYAFYQIATPVAILPAILLGVIISRDKLNATIETFLKGAGDTNIMAMCMIYLLAGAFSSVAQATGGVDATVNFALQFIPASFLLPGIFLVAAFISTAMGTSMGTIAAVAPIALGIAQSAGISLPLMAGVVMGGAMFGDNLSIISDTTIAATRSQGCEMKDKFRVNIYVATPAAIATIILLIWMGNGGVTANPADAQFVRVIPYLAILILALSGLNVFVVLFTGLILAGVIGLAGMPGYTLTTCAKDIYAGFTKMHEIFLLSMLIGGLSALMKQQGGLDFITHGIERFIKRFEGRSMVAEFGIAIIVSLTNICTANNTVAIIVSGSVARDLADTNGVENRRAASVLDIFSCVFQGLIPYGAQSLLAASLLGISPLRVITHTYYCMFLAAAGIADILVHAWLSGRRSDAVAAGDEIEESKVDAA